MSEAHEPTWLTQAAYDRLATELETLMTTARHEIAIKIAEARDEGDLKENGGYHAAKEEQGKIEARIYRLEV
jgi:transcription elongation factor GreA